jgi:hypothetical protein
LKRAVALAIMHEILNACQESITITSVSFDPLTALVVSNNRDYKIKIQCQLDSNSRDCLTTVATKYGIAIRENEGYVILSNYSSQ